MLPDRGMSKIRQNTDTIGSKVFGEHFDVIIDVAICSDFHVGKNNIMNPEDTLMHFLGKDRVHALVETF